MRRQLSLTFEEGHHHHAAMDGGLFTDGTDRKKDLFKLLALISFCAC